MRRLRVLQVVTDTTPRGAQTFGVDLHDELTRREHVVRTLALADEGADDPLPVQPLGRRRFGAETLRGLRRALRGADVVVAHGSSTLLACAATTLGTDRPFIYRSIGDIGYWATSPAKRARTRWGLGRASAVVALWPDAARNLVRGFGVDPERVHVIPNAVPASRWPAITPDERVAARRAFSLPERVPTLVYVGAVSHEKSVDTVILALASQPEPRLLVVGAGPMRAELEALARRVAGDRVVFLGQTDPRPAVAAADAIVLPSRSEGLPGVLIEAGLAGLPAVATDVGGVREIVVPELTGALVRPEDPAAFGVAIDRVLSNAEELGRRARERCLERFELTGVGTQWERLLLRTAR